MAQDIIKTLEERLAELEAELGRLETERSDITTALRINRRYIDEAKAKQPANVVVDASAEGPTPPATSALGGTPRPDGIPTIWEMTEQVLRECAEPGLRAHSIVLEIERRWWPGVRSGQVAPSIHKFAKTGRLNKTEDGLFCLPQQKAPDAGSGASSVTGENFSSPRSPDRA